QRVGEVGRARRLHVEIARTAIAGRIPGDDAVVAREMVELILPRLGGRANAVQQHERHSRPGFAPGKTESVHCHRLQLWQSHSVSPQLNTKPPLTGST